MRWLCFALVAVTGCAASSRSVVSQASPQRYTGDPYDVYDHGGRISGAVCGVNVEYSISHPDGGVRLNGFAGGRAVYFEVRDQPGGGRRVTGAFGTRVGTNEVDLLVAGGRLQGRSGVRRFDLVGVGDELRGSMSALNTLGPVGAVVAGRAALAQLPDAELGAILPSLLNCSAPFGGHTIRPSMVVRIGGPAGYDTRYANEIGRAN
jgi:hypothetical protein